MRVDQDDVKCAKEAKMALTARLCSAAEKIEKLKSELVVWKESDVYAPTFMQLETIHQEVIHLQVKLKAR